MPWKETNVMNLRQQFVLKAIEKNQTFQALCTEYGISTKTGYKWKERFLAEGLSGLKDLSRRPIKCPTRLSEDIICEIIKIKNMKKHWGPKKIWVLYGKNHPGERIPARSSVERILQRAGFVQPKRRIHHVIPERLQTRKRPEAPNDLWTVDFKGWWYTPEKEKCEPLTVRDEYSKYILSIEILEKGDTMSVRREFDKIFSKYGLPRTIRSDNGPPFASVHSILGLTQLSAWWLSLGINLDRIDPGAPYQNGGHERMHLDIKKELESKIVGSLRLHQSVFDSWRNEYNNERPHESLQMKTPGEIYNKSERAYDGEDFQLEYPNGFLNRKVNDRGAICHRGKKIFITNALQGLFVGVKHRGKILEEVWLNRTILGEIDLTSNLFRSILDSKDRVQETKRALPMS